MSSLEMIDKLKNKYEANKLAHAFLVETNNFELCLNDLKKFIKYINCDKEFTDNCDKCNICHLIDLDNLPSLVTISSDGISIKKEQLQDLQMKFSTKPIYSKYNVYIIYDACFMNSAASNSILKFLEEPNSHIIGFLVTKNKDKLLDTIVSRCENFKIIYDQSSGCDAEKYLLVKEYLNQIFNLKSNYINKNLILPVISERVEINKFFLLMLDYFLNEEVKNYFPGNNSVDKNMLKIYNERVSIIKKVIDMINQNVNIELLLDYFVIEMRNTNE